VTNTKCLAVIVTIFFLSWRFDPLYVVGFLWDFVPTLGAHLAASLVVPVVYVEPLAFICALILREFFVEL
jgi:hypothetical protein